MENNDQIIKVALIDDNELFREGLKRILDSVDLFEIIWEGTDILTFLEQNEVQPDIVLVDLQVYENSDIEKTIIANSKRPSINIALFTSEMNKHQMLTAIELGVKGYLTKEMEVHSLISALKSINKGKYWVHPDISDQLMSEYINSIGGTSQIVAGKRKQIIRPYNLLSDREYQVLELLAKGYNNQRIAETLGVTQSTVKNHVTSIFVKMKVNDRTQAVIKAIQNNWVEVNSIDLEPMH